MLIPLYTFLSYHASKHLYCQYAQFLTLIQIDNIFKLSLHSGLKHDMKTGQINNDCRAQVGQFFGQQMNIHHELL